MLKKENIQDCTCICKQSVCACVCVYSQQSAHTLQIANFDV